MDFEQEEQNGKLDKPQQWGKAPTRMTTVNFSAYLHEDANRENIKLKDATEFGIRFLISDKDGFDYPDCKLQDKLQKIIAHRNSLLHEIEILREAEDVEDVEDVKDVKEEIDKEMEDVFRGL